MYLNGKNLRILPWKFRGRFKDKLIGSPNFQDFLGLHKCCNVPVCYHCGGWPEEVNACFLNSYMVYL
jgi:hypothetical protein